MPINYRDLWYSGQIEAAAKAAKHPAALAAKFGVSPDALSRALRRLHEADHKVPKLHELLKKDPAAKARLPGGEVRGEGQAEPADTGEDVLSPIEEHRLKKKVRDLEALNKELLPNLF